MCGEDGLCIERMVHIQRGWSLYREDYPERIVHAQRGWSIY